MELFTLFGKIAIDNANANKTIDETNDKAKSLGSALGKAASKVGSAVQVAGKMVAAGAAAGAAAFGALTVKSLNATGELEQNMGGSEQVFKKYATSMQTTAKKAFSSMGLDTSKYLATANKMGALMQGAGLDIEESFNLTTEAMQRAADVASIMGIDTASAMESIAGAAKGNFTMMDNLGVAMNATTLEAYALSKGIKTTYAEMDNATKVQLAMEMFLEKTAYAAGNYTRENETLAGSISTTKAALTNFMNGSGGVNEVVTSLSGTVEVVGRALKDLVPRLVQSIPEMFTGMIPAASKGVADLLNAIGVEVDAADVESKINDLVSGVKGTIDTLSTECSKIAGTIKDKFSKIADTLEKNGVDIEDVFSGIQKAVETVAPTIDAAAGAIGEALNLLTDWATTDGSVLNTALQNIATSFGTLAGMATHYFRAIEKGLSGDFKGAIAEVGALYQTWFDGMREGFGNTADYANEKMGEIGDAINDQSLSISNVDTSGMEADLDEALIFALEIAGQIKVALNSLGTAASAGVGFTADSADLVGGVAWDTRWNADGAVLKKPTIFGRVGNTLLGGGEAGAEAVAPIDVLQGYVAEAVAGQNAGLLAALDRIYSATVALNENMAGHVRNGMDGVSFGVNKREFGRLVKDVT